MRKTLNQKAWFFVLPVFVLVAFNAAIPLMTVINYSFQETFGDNIFFGREQDGLNKYYGPIGFMQHWVGNFYLLFLF